MERLDTDMIYSRPIPLEGKPKVEGYITNVRVLAKEAKDWVLHWTPQPWLLAPGIWTLLWKWRSLSCVQLCDLMDYTVYGILQTKILEWVAFPSSRGSSKPRDQTQVSCIAGGLFTSWATREAHIQHCWKINIWNIAWGNGASVSLRQFFKKYEWHQNWPQKK